MRSARRLRYVSRPAALPSRRFGRRAGAERGYSLVEVLLATAVVALSMTALVTLLFRSQVSMERQTGQHDVRQSTRLALRDVASSLRVAGYNIKTAPEVLPDARADAISIAADIDDGDTAAPCTDESDPDAGVELVTYERSGDTLRRRIQCWDGAAWSTAQGQGWTTIATDLADDLVLFRYFDEAGAELTPPAGGTLPAADRARVTVVLIRLEVIDPGAPLVLSGEEHPTSTLTSRVRLRNAAS